LRWAKITAIAFSRTEKASELKNSIVSSRTAPTAARCSMNFEISARKACDWLGTSHSR
jgi:hypothetical protein